MRGVAFAAERNEIPHRSQYASPDLAAELQSGRLAYEDDPRWHELGARDPVEYRRWARCGCGMACLQMILAARGEAEQEIAPIAELGRRAIPYGAYEAEPAAGFGPLIYTGFVAFAGAEFDLRARVAAPLALDELERVVAGDEVVLASVSSEIRSLAPHPRRRGGHLVLVHDSRGGRLRFHDPAGDRPQNSAGVWLGIDEFERFYAGRGVAVELPRG